MRPLLPHDYCCFFFQPQEKRKRVFPFLLRFGVLQWTLIHKLIQDDGTDPGHCSGWSDRMSTTRLHRLESHATARQKGFYIFYLLVLAVHVYCKNIIILRHVVVILPRGTSRVASRKGLIRLIPPFLYISADFLPGKARCRCSLVCVGHGTNVPIQSLLVESEVGSCLFRQKRWQSYEEQQQRERDINLYLNDYIGYRSLHSNPGERDRIQYASHQDRISYTASAS